MLCYAMNEGREAGQASLPLTSLRRRGGTHPRRTCLRTNSEKQFCVSSSACFFPPSAPWELGPPFLSLESGLRDPLSSQDRSQVNFNPAKRGFRLGLLYRVFPFPPLFFPDVSIIEACQSANTTDLSAPLSACCDFQGPAPTIWWDQGHILKPMVGSRL